jgi:membrane fusion protein
VTGIAVALALALIAFACWGEITRKARLPGLLVPMGGMINVPAPQAGTVAELLVQEGATVQAGEPLMRLKSERMTQAGDAASLNAQALAQRRASLDTERLLTQQQARQRQDALADRLRSLLGEERQAQAELETNRLRVQLAMKSQERYAELGRSGFVSAAQAQQKQEELLDLQLRERNAERNLQALQRDMQALRAEQQANQTSAQTSLAQLDRGLATLKQEATENDARGGVTVNAPQSGRVSALTLHTGQTVQTGQTLVSMIPHRAVIGGESRALEAQLFAPSRTAGFVRAGQTVWMRYAAYPYQKFGMAEGRVLAVSESPIAPQDLPLGQGQALLAAVQSNEPLYRISVELATQDISTYGERSTLKTGMALEADVVLERLHIWEWILEPLLAVKIIPS